MYMTECSSGPIPSLQTYASSTVGSKLAEDKHLGRAVAALDLKVREGAYIDNSVFHGLLRRCIVEKDLVVGRWIHSLAVKCGYESNSFVSNHLICMYSHHGKLVEATTVFSKVRAPSRYMWASIILAHARNGYPVEAVRFYKHMQLSAVKPDNHIFVAVLKACAVAGDLPSGRQVHADILRTGHASDIFVGTCLVDMYAKCQSLEDARNVFDCLPNKNLVTWTAMITGYAQQGYGEEALAVYESMLKDGLTPSSATTFISLLQACSKIKALHQGKLLHLQVMQQGLHTDVVVGTCLVDMYAKWGSLEEARTVFNNLPNKNMLTWTAMIAGYANHGFGEQALALFKDYEQMDMCPSDAATFVCLLQACASMGALQQGKQLHAQIQEQGLGTDVVVGCCLVDMYAKCGSLSDARRVFDLLPSKDVVTWNVIIAGYAQAGLREEAFSLYFSLLEEGTNQPNASTFVCLLQVCARHADLQCGKQLHAQILERNFQNDLIVGTSLVDMYAKCASFEDACKVFDTMPHKTAVTWTAMIAGYVQNGHSEQALFFYANMQQAGITLVDAVTYVCLLHACGSVAALDKGKEIHALILRSGLEATNLFVASTLINMYGKCGNMVDAQQVFDALPTKDIVTWNTLMAGYAHEGNSELVFKLLQRMMLDGMQPNDVTLLTVLSVCSHAGLWDKGQKYFKAMSDEFSLTPSLEHYNCMVNLLGRAGQLKEALNLIVTMPLQPPSQVWICLLSACQKWRNVSLGRKAFDQAVRSEKGDAAAYVLMANIYADAQAWAEAKEIQTMRVKSQAWKQPGQSWWADSAGIVYTFMVGDIYQPKMHCIHDILIDILLKLNEGGSVPQPAFALVDLNKDELEHDANAFLRVQASRVTKLTGEAVTCT